jgi:hypothetical protein
MTGANLSNQSPLRIAALAFATIGAIGSLYFMFSAGRDNPSIILMGLFAAWVLAPFAGLLIIDQISNRLKLINRVALHWLIIFLSIGSLISYSGALLPSDTKAAFIFLVFPFASWILIGLVFLIMWKTSAKSE